jgi:hypothetical protein
LSVLNWFRTEPGGGLVNTTVKLKTLPLEITLKVSDRLVDFSECPAHVHVFIIVVKYLSTRR